METVKNIYLAHERDAAWLLALYIAINGGDPPHQEKTLVAQELQEAAALSAIAALATALDTKTQHAVQQAIAPMKAQHEMHRVDAETALGRLGSLGIYLDGPGHCHAPDSARKEFPTFVSRSYCFHLGGVTYCFVVKPHDVRSVG